MALVPWGGSSATTFSEPSSSPFAPNGIIYANDVNAAIRVPSLVASAIWNTLGATNVDYQSSLTNAEDALSATVLACGMTYNSTDSTWVFPNKIEFGDNATFDRGVEFSSAIVVDGTTALSSTLYVSGSTALSSTLTVDGATTLNSSLTVSGGAVLTRASTTQKALEIKTGTSTFESQTINNITYVSAYNSSHQFFLATYSGSNTSVPPTNNTIISADSIETPEIKNLTISGINTINASKGTGIPGEAVYDFGNISKGIYVLCVNITIGTTQSYIAQSIFCYTSSTITGVNTPAEIYFSPYFGGSATITKGTTNHIIVHIAEQGNRTLGQTAYLYKLSGIIES